MWFFIWCPLFRSIRLIKIINRYIFIMISLRLTSPSRWSLRNFLNSNLSYVCKSYNGLSIPSFISSYSDSTHPSIEYAGPPNNPSVRDGGTPPFCYITSCYIRYLKLLNRFICNSLSSGSISFWLMIVFEVKLGLSFFLVSFNLVLRPEVYKERRIEFLRPE